jgi:hypothetical protein
MNHPSIGGIGAAAEFAKATAGMTAGSAGSVIAAHRRLAVDSSAVLTAAGQADKAFHAYLTAAAALSQAGARRLDAIAACTSATAQAGVGATSPAAQRVVLSVLRSQVVRAAEVVESVNRQGADIAGRIASLHYEPPVKGPALTAPVPDGPIVWCLRPRGTFGFYRCSVLYPDLSVGSYWSRTDDSGGQ